MCKLDHNIGMVVLATTHPLAANGLKTNCPVEHATRAGRGNILPALPFV